MSYSVRYTVCVCVGQMKEFLFKFVVQALWRRRKQLYYAVSVVSIAGNLVVLVGPSVESSIVLRSGVLKAVQSMLPQVAELVLHRSVLYILLNLIVVRMVAKSGMLSRTTPGVPLKVDDFHLPSSSYVVRGLPWPATNSYSIYETQTQTMPCVTMFTDPSMWLQQALCSNDQNSGTVDACAQTPAQKQRPTIKKSWDDEQPKCAPAPSLFTIEPLEELVQTAHSNTLKDDQAQVNKTHKYPLRKVASRRADLHRSTQAHATGKTKHSKKAVELPQKKDEQLMQLDLQARGAGKSTHLRKAVDLPQKKDEAVELPQQKDEQSMQQAKQDGERGSGEDAAEDEDNRLSRQEFNERVDTFISKFKRSLTMQRQDSLNRLLGLVGGGGDIRLLK